MLAGEQRYAGMQENPGTSHPDGQRRLLVTSPMCLSIFSLSAAHNFWPLWTARPHCCLVLSFLLQPLLTALQHRQPIWTKFRVLRGRCQCRYSRNKRDTPPVKSSAYKAKPSALVEYFSSTLLSPVYNIRKGKNEGTLLNLPGTGLRLHSVCSSLMSMKLGHPTTQGDKIWAPVMAPTTRLQEPLIWSEIRNSNPAAREKTFSTWVAVTTSFCYIHTQRHLSFKSSCLSSKLNLWLRRAATDRLKNTLLPEIRGPTAVQVSQSFSRYLSESKTSLPSTDQQRTLLGKMRTFITLTSCILELITVHWLNCMLGNVTFWSTWNYLLCKIN